MIVSTVTGTDNVTLADVKKHVNVTFADDDAYLTALISVSLNAVENYCRTHFIERENVENIGKFDTGLIPSRLMTSITHTPNDGIVTISYTDGTAKTLDVKKSSIYTRTDNNYVYINNVIIVGLLDSITVDPTVDVTLKWKTGISGTMDQAIKHARLLLIGTYYENRESDIIGLSTGELPQGIKFLLEAYTNPQVG